MTNLEATDPKPHHEHMMSNIEVIDEKYHDTRHKIYAVFKGSVGNLVEYYDWYVYSAFSLYFSKYFFPGDDPTVQLLNTSAIFALGFFMRPIGGWLFGVYADRKGRKNALLLSVSMMCGGSLIIAVMPGYNAVGIAAPIALILARLLQGLSLGGEYGSSATYLAEISTKEKRGFYSSFQYVTLIMGQLLALGVLIALQRVFLTQAQLEAWGWRIPFVIGGLCAVIAIFLRRSMEETESFEHHKSHKKEESSLRALMRHPRAVLTVIGLTMGGTVAFYTFTTYMQKYLVNTVGFSKNDATMISAGATFIYMLMQPVVGALSDKLGRRTVLIAFGVLSTLCTVPILTALGDTHSQWGAFFLMLAALTIVSGYSAINAVVKAELFPVEIRALGVGLPFAIGVSLFGGTAEYIALWFKSMGHEPWFYWYVTGCCFAGLVLFVTMQDTKTHSQIDED